MLLFSLCLLLLPAAARAQSPVVVAWETDPPPAGGWTVGDLVPLRLRVTYPDGLEVILPELPGQWGTFEVREQELLEATPNDDGTLSAVRRIVVTLWSPGEHATPPFSIRYRDAGGELHEVAVAPLPITIGSVLPTPDGGAGGDVEKRDLKPQAVLPRPPWWPWALGGLLGAALVLVAARWALRRLRRRAQAGATEVIPVLDPRPPEAIAYEELERIAALDLPAQAEFKRHYTLVADCVRTFVEGVYHVPALDRTTGELLSALRRVRQAATATGLLRELLEEADFVKFARFRPGVEQARAAVPMARRFVDAATPTTEEINHGDTEDTEGC
jgi:hypothetical protein